MPETGGYSETSNQGTSGEVLDGFERDFSHPSTAHFSALRVLMFAVVENSKENPQIHLMLKIACINITVYVLRSKGRRHDPNQLGLEL